MSVERVSKHDPFVDSCILLAATCAGIGISNHSLNFSNFLPTLSIIQVLLINSRLFILLPCTVHLLQNYTYSSLQNLSFNEFSALSRRKRNEKKKKKNCKIVKLNDRSNPCVFSSSNRQSNCQQRSSAKLISKLVAERRRRFSLHALNSR